MNRITGLVDVLLDGTVSKMSAGTWLMVVRCSVCMSKVFDTGMVDRMKLYDRKILGRKRTGGIQVMASPETSTCPVTYILLTKHDGHNLDGDEPCELSRLGLRCTRPSTDAEVRGREDDYGVSKSTNVGVLRIVGGKYKSVRLAERLKPDRAPYLWNL